MVDDKIATSREVPGPIPSSRYSSLAVAQRTYVSLVNEMGYQRDAAYRSSGLGYEIGRSERRRVQFFGGYL